MGVLWDRAAGARQLRSGVLHSAAGGVPLTWTVADTARSIPEAFSQQARAYPGKRAVGGTRWQPSFAELDAAANRLARVLIDRAGPARGRVALLVGHDAPMIAAVLGVLKAGKTVVVLNPGDPPARLGQIRAEVEPQLVLADSRRRDLALRAGFATFQVTTVPELSDGGHEAAPTVAVQPDDAAFLIFTSGSAGRPTGVIQTHRNILHNVLVRHSNGFGLVADDGIALLASVSGGQGMATLWTALLNGATLFPFPIMDRGVTGLSPWLMEHGVTMLTVSASVFRHLVRTLDGTRLPGIRLLRLASEPAFSDDFEAFRRHFPDTCLLINTLSSSEAGNIAQCLFSAEAHVVDERLPAGRPPEGIELLLLDDEGAEVPAGSTGEIVVRSHYLSPGYWRNDPLTSGRFGRQGAAGAPRLFYSGDLGRVSEDGRLTWVGRKDARVKVRGTRVELSEVESAIAAHPQIADAAVCAGATRSGDARLTAYVVPRPGCVPAAEDLRRALRASLPDASVPTAFAFLDSFPLTPHGKVDRNRLSGIEPPLPEHLARAPMNETEELLAGLWAAALECDWVDRDQNFFDLGGDSLTATVIAAGVHATFGVEIGLRAFAEHPTVGAMAEVVDHERVASSVDRPALSRASRAELPPLSFAQELTWRMSRTPQTSFGYTVAVSVRIRGALDVDALRRSVDYIVARHEILRTTFTEHGGRPVQIVHPAERVHLPLVDLTAAVHPARAADQLLAREALLPFDVERGPLLRLRLARLSDDEYRLLRVNHHIISDGWSWRIFFDELRVLYEADRRGAAPPLPRRLALQYADFAVWERQALTPDGWGHRKHLEWWRRMVEGDPGPIPLPFARPGPRTEAAAQEGVIWWGLDPDMSRGLDRLGRQARATYYMVRLAAFTAQLATETGWEDLVLGTYLTNRRFSELQAMFGFFSNLVMLRLRFGGNPTFRQWLERVREAVLETSVHAEIPYQHVCSALQQDGVAPPDLRAVFSVADHVPPMRFAELEVVPLRRAFEVMPWGFTLQMDRWAEADNCVATFDARIYDPQAVRSFITRFRRLVREACADPDRPLRQGPGDVGATGVRAHLEHRARRPLA